MALNKGPEGAPGSSETTKGTLASSCAPAPARPVATEAPKTSCAARLQVRLAKA